jgi:hypothetical protein
MSTRIDYLRFRIHTADSEDRNIGADLTVRCEALSRSMKLEGKSYDVQSSYNRQLKRFVGFFNCWGALAQQLFNEIPVHYMKYLMRADIRTDCGLSGIPVETVEKALRAGATSRNTIGRTTSPARTKRGGRDAGGDGVHIGSKESQYRLSYYQRGKEARAVELQLQGAALARVVGAAFQMAGDVPETKRKFIAALTDEMGRYFASKAGFEIGKLITGSVTEADMFDTVESQLDMMEAMFGALPIEAQQAFLETASGQLLELDGVAPVTYTNAELQDMYDHSVFDSDTEYMEGREGE